MVSMPFEGLKVIDLCWSGAGASIMNLFSHYGAMVIRVESARQTDPIRRVLTYTDYTKDSPHALELSAYYAFSHPARKYGMTLDLKNPGAKEVLKKLIAKCDVIGESFPTGVIERLGFDYETVKSIKPDIIMFRSCGYGHTGPMARQAGFGMILSAYSMMYSLSGWPDREPVPVSSYYTDQLSPLCGMLALTAALDYRRRTGKGQCIDHSQIESGLNYVTPLILDYAANGHELPLMGNKCDYAAPHGVYRCKGDDRWVAIAVTTDEEWVSFCRVLRNPAWTKEPKFKDLENRLKNNDKLDKLVEDWTENNSPEFVMEVLQKAGVGAGVVSNAQDLCEDPQLNHYEFFREVEHPYTGKAKYYHPPAFKLPDAPASVGRPTLLGEHNEYICRELLGMSDAEFARLQQEGAFQ
jgi:benzylsuccinate CoA-transferase BbsF subunit